MKRKTLSNLMWLEKKKFGKLCDTTSEEQIEADFVEELNFFEESEGSLAKTFFEGEIISVNEVLVENPNIEECSSYEDILALTLISMVWLCFKAPS